MCLIGLLLPFKHRKKSRKHKSRSSSHRRSEQAHRERSRRREKDEIENSTIIAHDALAQLCLSLEQSLVEGQQRWRDQGRLNITPQRQYLGLVRDQTPCEEAPPYSPRDDTAHQPSTERRYQTGVADSPECRSGSSFGSTYCCCSCICTRCGSANMKCPTIPELDDSRARAFREGGTETRRRRA